MDDETLERGRQRMLEIHGERSVATVAVLVALGRSSQLPIHLRSSLKAGLSVEELQEVILQTAVLAGGPPAMNAWSTLRTIASEPDGP